MSLATMIVSLVLAVFLGELPPLAMPVGTSAVCGHGSFTAARAVPRPAALISLCRRENAARTVNGRRRELGA